MRHFPPAACQGGAGCLRSINHAAGGVCPICGDLGGLLSFSGVACRSPPQDQRCTIPAVHHSICRYALECGGITSLRCFLTPTRSHSPGSKPKDLLDSSQPPSDQNTAWSAPRYQIGTMSPQRQTTQMSEVWILDFDWKKYKNSSNWESSCGVALLRSKGLLAFGNVLRLQVSDSDYALTIRAKFGARSSATACVKRLASSKNNWHVWYVALKVIPGQGR
jgi:hypothetical protein